MENRINIEENVSTNFLGKGQELHSYLNQLDKDQKICLVAYRFFSGGIDDEVREEVLEADRNAILDTIVDQGFALIGDEEFKSLIDGLVSEIGSICEDSESWAMFTVLEIIDYKEYEDSYKEAAILQNGDRINEVDIDLVADEDILELMTCKFKPSNQGDALRSKIKELESVQDELECESALKVGTLSLKSKKKLQQQELDVKENLSDLIAEIINAREIYSI